MLRVGRHWVPLVLTTMLGCAPGEPQPSKPKRAGDGVTRTAQAGSITLIVSIDRDRAAIAEPIALTVTAVAPDRIEVTMPDVAEELSGLEVVVASPITPSALANGQRQWSREYTLEAYSGGEYQIPPLKVGYTDSGDAPPATASQPAQTGEVTVEAIPIEVISALKADADPTAFRDIKPLAAVELKRNWTRLGWVAGAVVLALVVGIWLWRRRTGAAQTSEAFVMPPHEWAFRELDRLMAEDLVRRGEIHEHYFRLSGITREYIERRFRVSAPEMTTEEFLLQVRDARYLDEPQKQAMAKFLEACDLVKFAKYQPSAGEIEQASNAARDFVSQTAPRTDEVSGATKQEAAA